MLPACSASVPAGISSQSRPRPLPASRPVSGRSEPAACPVIWSPASCPGLSPRRHLVPVPASAPAGISSGLWPLRARCLPGDLVTDILSRPRPSLASRPVPGSSESATCPCDLVAGTATCPILFFTTIDP